MRTRCLRHSPNRLSASAAEVRTIQGNTRAWYSVGDETHGRDVAGRGGRRALLAEVAARLPGRTVTVCGYPGLDGVAAAPQLSTLDDLMQRLLAGLPECFDLVAKSMGSVLALRLVLAAPQRVRRLVLLATTGGLDVAAEGAAEWREAFVRAYPEAPRWFVDDRSDVEAELGRVQQPTLLLFGEADELAPVAVGRRLLAGCRGRGWRCSRRRRTTSRASSPTWWRR